MSTQDNGIDAAKMQQQNVFWSVQACGVALAVRRLWKAMAKVLGISEDDVQVITNLAKASSDHTLSVSELAHASDLSFEQAADAIDTLVARNWAVRVLRRDGETKQDRRVQLPDDLVRDVVGFYALQPHHRALLAKYTDEQLAMAAQVFQDMMKIADDQADGLLTGRVIAGKGLIARAGHAG